MKKGEEVGSCHHGDTSQHPFKEKKGSGGTHRGRSVAQQEL